MRFTPLPLSGAYVIDLEPHLDERGFFARTFDADEFAAHGLVGTFVQISHSLSHMAGTLRGLHYQKAPHAETKLVRCLRGALWDVILDLRPSSPTFGEIHHADLTADNRRAIYVPKGFAHGSITLAEDTELMYMVDEPYTPSHEAGVRWNDPSFHIPWPKQPALISERDRAFPDFQREDPASQARHHSR